MPVQTVTAHSVGSFCLSKGKASNSYLCGYIVWHFSVHCISSDALLSKFGPPGFLRNRKALCVLKVSCLTFLYRSIARSVLFVWLGPGACNLHVSHMIESKLTENDFSLNPLTIIHSFDSFRAWRRSLSDLASVAAYNEMLRDPRALTSSNRVASLNYIGHSCKQHKQVTPLWRHNWRKHDRCLCKLIESVFEWLSIERHAIRKLLLYDATMMLVLVYEEKIWEILSLY